MQTSQAIHLGMADLMTISVVILFLSLTLNYPANRWVNIIVAAFFFRFNLVGLPTHPSVHEKFLIVVGLVFNALTVWYA